MATDDIDSHDDRPPLLSSTKTAVMGTANVARSESDIHTLYLS